MLMSEARWFIHSKIFYGNLLQAEGTHVKLPPWGIVFLQSHVWNKERMFASSKQKPQGHILGFPLPAGQLVYLRHSISSRCTEDLLSNTVICCPVRPGCRVNLSEIEDSKKVLLRSQDLNEFGMDTKDRSGRWSRQSLLSCGKAFALKPG